MDKSRSIVVLTLLYFIILGCFLSGCSDVGEKSPISALIDDISQDDITANSAIKNNTILVNETIKVEDISANKIMVSENSIFFKVISAYNGNPLEYATVKINGENIGVTNSYGEVSVCDLKEERLVIEVSKEKFETLTTIKNITENDYGKTIIITMIEDTGDSLGSVTGIFLDRIKYKGVGNLYIRLYKLNENQDIYDLDRDFILTTKTSSEYGLEGSFKITNLDSGFYQVYIGYNSTIPEIKKIDKYYKLKNNNDGELFLSDPFEIQANKTSYLCCIK